MKKNFLNSVEMVINDHNSFDMGYTWQGSGVIGALIPTMWKPTYPGETVRLGNRGQVRFSPMVLPSYARFQYKTEHFGIPKAAMWKNYEKWISLEKDEFGNLPAAPTITFLENGSNWTPLAGYLGVPNPALVNTVTNLTVSAFPFMAYLHIWYYWYRDQNLQLFDEADLELVDGDNSANTALFGMQYRSLMPDLATKSLPFAQKGNPVSLPLGEIGLDPTWDTPAISPKPRFVTTAGVTAIGAVDMFTDGTNPGIEIANNATFHAYDPAGTLKVNATTINDLRTAEAMQLFEEMQARGGSRYFETAQNYFNKTIPDYRLRQPELIGGSVTPIIISEVQQTSETGATPQGNVSGYAKGYNLHDDAQWHSAEWGICMTITSVMPPTAYMQGVNKDFLTHVSPFQELFPVLADLGEEQMQTNEIYAYQDTDTYHGFLPRYYNLRMSQNVVCGAFTDPSLRAWTAAKEFPSAPALNAAFIICNPSDYEYLFADTTDSDKLYFNIYNDVWIHQRQLSKYGTPQMPR